MVEKIITIEEEEKIKACTMKSDKVRMLLLNISGPLKAGDNDGFYVMLKIMKCFGTRATQNLAAHIESCVAPGAEQNERKLPGCYPDSSESM